MVRWPRDRGMWLLVAALTLLLGILAALQYHWTGEIGRAEAERQRTRLDRGAQRYARELGRELGRAAMAFRPEMSRRGGGDARASLLQRLEAWSSTEHSGLVSRLVLITPSDSGPPIAEAAEVGRPEFVDVPFPSQLEPLRPQLEDRAGRLSRRSFPPGPMPGPPPSFLMPVIEPGVGARPRFPPGAFVLSGIAVIELSESYLGDVLFPELAEAHFGPLDEGDYVVAVQRRADGSLLYTSDPELSPDELARPDVRLGLPLAFEGPGSPGDRFERGFPFGGRGELRGGRPDLAPETPFGGGPAGPPHEPPADAREGKPKGGGAPWVLLVRHRGGSLAEAVEAARRRNLAVGLGVLALLGTAVVLLAVGAQRARHLARQQLEFVAGVTHELNTPLTALRSAGQNLADGVVSDPEQVRRYGHLIQKEGDRLTALVSQVLDFADIESGSGAYSLERVPVEPLLRKTVGDLGLVLEQSGMSIEVDVAANLPDIRGDEQALQRALENLIANAVKFARQGAWIGIDAAASADRPRVVLRVADRGPGIPKSERTRVFEPFYRGDDARRGQAPGSGLGLSLVRHVVEAHGGRVEAGARDGGGAVITVELPFAEGGEQRR